MANLTRQMYTTVVVMGTHKLMSWVGSRDLHLVEARTPDPGQANCGIEVPDQARRFQWTTDTPAQVCDECYILWKGGQLSLFDQGLTT